MPQQLEIVILGLSITSSWGNGHATTYRGLVRSLAALGHEVLFLERDVPWYAENRDLAGSLGGRVRLYSCLEELRELYLDKIRRADLALVGSYVPDGVAVGALVTSEARGATAFYDIDTPVTLAKLSRRDFEYLTPELIGKYDLYLSFTGGPTLVRLMRKYDASMARVLYCSVDPEQYCPQDVETERDLGYLGTYSDDRQPALKRLLIEPARRWSAGRFVVAGPLYPDGIDWPDNVSRIEHVAPALHRAFYCSQRFTLNVTRRDMRRAGFSPSVRLFEAAACGVPIISDWWEGLDEILEPGGEVLIAKSTADVLKYLRDLPDSARRSIGTRARRRILSQHTALLRARELQRYVLEVLARKGPRGGRGSSNGGRTAPPAARNGLAAQKCRAPAAAPNRNRSCVVDGQDVF